jgi:hypothetical protein
MRTFALIPSVFLLALGLVLTASAYFALIGLPILVGGLLLLAYNFSGASSPAPSAVVATRPRVAAVRSGGTTPTFALLASLFLMAVGLVLTASAYLAVIGLPILVGGLFLLVYAFSRPTPLAPSH